MTIYELLHDDKYYYIVSELVLGGELYDHIVEMTTLSEKDVKHVVY